jgi:hypothetical protein
MTRMPTIQIVFLDADTTRPDSAQTGATARAAVAALRADGHVLTPAYDGAMGGELFELVRTLAEGAAANKDIVLALITGIAAPIAAGLAAKLKEKPVPAASPVAPQVTVVIAGVRATAEPGITDAELLHRLLAVDPTLPQRITPDSAVRIEVRVPPRG